MNLSVGYCPWGLTDKGQTEYVKRKQRQHTETPARRRRSTGTTRSHIRGTADPLVHFRRWTVPRCRRNGRPTNGSWVVSIRSLPEPQEGLDADTG